MVKITIDDREIEVEPGSMVIQAADKLKIPIPRFCYHEKLSIAANCRMCLVEVEKVPKPLPACATPVSDGMVVYTRSKLARAAQKAVMEFLLINHPLDCPICDQGGECELQDVAMGYGNSASRYQERKRVVKDKSLGSLISTDMTRCIHCTRCVRFGEEIAGERELGATGRGEFTEIGTYIENTVTSEISGNVIDLCPVGALTSKPFRFKARTIEMNIANSISPHDCMGSNLQVHTRRGEVLRVVPKDNEELNEIWLSDRDRFSYEALNSEDRLQYPIVKHGKNWIRMDWSEALEFVVTKIKQHQDSLGCLISPNTTIEEGYLWQKLLGELGSHNVDHRLRQLDFRDQDMAGLMPNLGDFICEINNYKDILVVGSRINKELPLLAVRIRNAIKNGTNCFVVNPVDFGLNLDLTAAEYAADDMVASLAGILLTLQSMQKKKLPEKLLEHIDFAKPSEEAVRIADYLSNSEKAIIVLGNIAIMDANYSRIIALCNYIAELTGARIGMITEGANSAGLWLTGCVSHRGPFGKKLKKPGLNAKEMLEDGLDCYILGGVEPKFDSILGQTAQNSLAKAKTVLAFSSHTNNSLCDVADIILPIAPFAENSGTYINCDLEWQNFTACVQPQGESRPLWKILRVLGNLFNVDGFDYMTSQDVLDDVISGTSQNHPLVFWEKWCPNTLNMRKDSNGKLHQIIPVGSYAVDMLARNAQALNKMQQHMASHVEISSQLKAKLKLQAKEKVKVMTGDFSVVTDFRLNDKLPANCVIIPQGVGDFAELDLSSVNLEIEKA